MRLIEDAAGVRGREVIPRVIPVPNPAAGAEWSTSIPGGVIWYIQTARFRLAASAAAVTRGPHFLISDGSTTLVTMPLGFTLAANGTTDTTMIRGIATSIVTGGVTVGALQPAPPIPLLGGWVIGSSTIGLDVGDQYSFIVLHVLEVEERPYDVELARDLATLRGNTSNAYPEIREGL